jgi:hypothetical protein
VGGINLAVWLFHQLYFIFISYFQRIEIAFVIAVNLIGSTANRYIFRSIFIFQGIADGDRHRTTVRSAKTSGSAIITDGVHKNFPCGHFIAS